MEDPGDAAVMEIKRSLDAFGLTLSQFASFLDSFSFMVILSLLGHEPCLSLSYSVLGPLFIRDPLVHPWLSHHVLPTSLVQVTEGKQDLERASQLSRKMRKEADTLSEWLSATEAELVQKSTSEGVIGDLDTEISWAKVSFPWDGSWCHASGIHMG